MKFIFFRQDSVVSDQINYDLLKKVQKIQEGTLMEPSLFGQGNHSKTKDFIPPAIVKQWNGCCKDTINIH